MPIFNEINQLIDQNKCFVVYAKPNSKELTLWKQNNNDLVEFHGQSGFVICSFDKSRNYIFELKNSTVSKYNITINSISFKNNFSQENHYDKDNFEKLVQKAKNAIEVSDFEKVVLSRKITVNETIHVLDSFTNLLSAYPNAYRYLFCHEKLGVWMGATPEQLVKIDETEFETVALAGTKIFEDQLIWKSKEIEEQQIVVDFIKEQTKDIVEFLNIEEPITVKAGNLAHLKSKIKGKLINRSQDIELLYNLHPTSAVCGAPFKNSYNFILQNENYDRKFYSGFIGEWNIDNKSDIFVNIRCCEIEHVSNSLAYIYVGSGITKDSVPENEFWETENKSKTIRNILV